MRGVLSQCVCIASYHKVHFKYITISYASYTPIMLKIDLIDKLCNCIGLAKKKRMSFLANPNILKHPDSQEESFGGTSILIGQILTIYWD